MITRENIRIRIDERGCLEVVDPGFDSLELIRTIDPGFRIRSAELQGFRSSRFMRTREIGCGVMICEINREREELLWNIHSDVLTLIRSKKAIPKRHESEASVLDLKIELSKRVLSNCRLCGRRCGVDRIQGEPGKCQLGAEAIAASCFVHIAEEPPINPSMLISLAGCGLGCRYCQQWRLLDTTEVNGRQLDASLWQELCWEKARSLSFIGGNPDESLYSILCFLKLAPANMKEELSNVPVVWNCNGYESTETLQLLDGIVDVYLPDFKYGNEDCGRRLSSAPDYLDVAKSAIEAMLAQEVPVIVRILVLPGHFDCCHAPVLDYLASVHYEQLLISIRGQYYPDWKITSDDGEMTRRPSMDEVEKVRELARERGLFIID